MIQAVQQSISRRFSVTIIGVVAVIASVFAVLLIVYSNNKLESQLQRQLSGASRMAETSLPTPLWQFNYDFFGDFLDALFTNEQFVYAVIIAYDEVVATKTHPDFSEKDWSFFEQSSQFLTVIAEITYEEKKVGEFHLAASKAEIRQELMSRTIAIVLFTFLLIVAISLTSISVTKRYIILPLAHLVDSATLIAEGELYVKGDAALTIGDARNEIGVLTNVFQHMLAYLRTMATMATDISNGDLHQQIVPKSEQDVLGNAFQHMTAYLHQIGFVAEKISQGNLAGQIIPRSERDQIGKAFAHMQAGLIELISKIHSESGDITLISSQMLKISSYNATALDQIRQAAEATSSAMQQMSASAKNIRVNTEHLSSAVESIRQMVDSIEHVAADSRTLSEFADNTTTTVLNIMHSLEKIAEQADHSKTLAETTTHDAVSGTASVNQVITSIHSISEITELISDLITRLQSHSQAIGTILDVINEVADQTSLLSLNASIIAAQAGVHGRGFAVVADEIKELATRVGSSTREIAKIIGDVQRDSSEVAKAIEQGHNRVEQGAVVAHQAGEALGKIERSAENSSQVAAEIAAVVRQQTTAGTNITRSIQDVSTMISEITRAIQEQERHSAQLFKVAENMQHISLQVLDATREQQENTVNVVDSMQHVISLVLQNSETVQILEESSHELTRKAKVLKEQVDHFSIPEQTSSSS